MSHQTESVEHRTFRDKVVDEVEDLVGDAFPRRSAMSKLLAVPHHGFCAPMDALKERNHLEELLDVPAQPALTT